MDTSNLFGEDEDSDTEVDELAEFLQNRVFLELLRHKRKKFTDSGSTQTARRSFDKEILLIPSLGRAEFFDLRNLAGKCNAIDGFRAVSHPLDLTRELAADRDEIYDIVVDFLNLPGDLHAYCKVAESLIVPGGFFFMLSETEKVESSIDFSHIFLHPFWCNLSFILLEMGTQKYILNSAQRCFTRFNPAGALYWTGTDPARLKQEQDLMDSISVPLTVNERKLSRLGYESHEKAVAALSKHGVCIVSGLFSSEYILSLGHAALEDLGDAIEKLKERGIDINRPGEGPMINNFHELSMREARRCDLRNGSHMKAAARRHSELEAAFRAAASRELTGHKDLDRYLRIEYQELLAGGAMASPSSEQTESEATGSPYDSRNLRYHPSILAILRENMYVSGGEDEKGNWGRWNFEGLGPESGPPPLTVGQMGAVMSLPGSGDQTIHADTSHIFVHTQLPAHYVNMFLPAVEGSDFSVGQTVFVAGSHILRTSAKVMTEDGGQRELETRLVRPHLKAGDLLLFDCRILHFGLANQSNYIRLPSGAVSLSVEGTSHQDTRSYGRFLTPKEIFEAAYSAAVRRTGDGGKAVGHTSLSLGCPDSTLFCSEPSPCIRPILYINYTHQWFQDPKNWNEAEKLFEDEADSNSLVDSSP